MKKRIKVFAAVSLFAMSVFSVGCGSTGQPIAKLISFTGDVKAKIANNEDFNAVTADQQMASGDAIKTGEEARVEIELISDKSQMALSSNTYLEIKNYSEKEMRQMSGIAIYKISPQHKELKIQTPQGMATVLGTIFRIDTSAAETIITVEKGKVGFARQSGQQVIIEDGMQFSTNSSDNKAITIDPLEREQLFNLGQNLKPILNPR